MMLAIGIRYLNGWAMASHPADRERPEWPPHPDRVFMALAAAHFDGDCDGEERVALEWLEKQGPPTVVASGACDRKTVTTFVPVNDDYSPLTKDKKKSLAPMGTLAIGRDRKERCFPVAIPHDPTVFLCWDRAEPNELQRHSLNQLTAKVAAVGHSASLVQMWVADGDAKSLEGEESTRRTLLPVENATGGKRLRIYGKGRLQQLEQWFEAGLRPMSSLWCGYATAEPQPTVPDIATSHFASNLIVLRQVNGRRFGLESTLLLTKTLRDTVMSNCPARPLPEWLSGHQQNGAASQRERGHLALVPLPHVGRRHADGHLLGMALAVPRDVSQAEIAQCLGSWLLNDAGWPQPIRLTFGRLGHCELEVDESEGYRQALNPMTWCGPSRRWATVTPISFDRHAKSKEPLMEIEAFIADSCERIGLPRPTEVIATPVPMFFGVPHSREMPRILRKSDGGKNRQTHAILTFDREVQGPMLIGAGRYRGYGFCRPLRDVEDEA